MRSKKEIIIDYALITLGSAMIALATNWVFSPLNIVSGGFTGLEIVIKEWTRGLVSGGVPLWASNVVLNLPLFIVAYILRGKEFVGKTLYATIIFTVFLGIIPEWLPLGHDMVLSILYGSVVSGIGIGLVFIRYATTGGTDMLGALIQVYKKHWHMTTIMAVLDILIVILGAITFGLSNALYAIISIVIVTFIAGRIQEGVKFAKSVYIISEKLDEIAKFIDQDLDRGVTFIKVEGYYNDDDKMMLYTVLNQKELGKLKHQVSLIDKESFVIVGDVREVFGNGWLKHGKQLY